MRISTLDLPERIVEKIAYAKTPPPKPRRPLKDRCWLWCAFRNHDGYGITRLKPWSTHRAHRILYQVAFGPLRAGEDLDHVCRRRHCVNPNHLEVVDNELNSFYSQHERSNMGSHCNKGHALEDNVYISSSGSRTCKTCHKESARRRRERARLAKEQGSTQGPRHRHDTWGARCTHGHLYTADSQLRKSGGRVCRTCKQEWDKRFREKRSAAKATKAKATKAKATKATKAKATKATKAKATKATKS